ncbi:MAG: hypothetical protein ACRD2H_13890 [Terriglobales bacterium]
MNDRKLTAALVGIYATFALDVFSTFTSSPQTTELNAKTRADTLMKWVRIGLIVALVGGAAGSAIEGNGTPFIATATVAVMMTLMYVYAKNAGLKSDAPGTETY